MKSYRKKLMIIIIILAVLLLIAMCGLIFVYATTDFLKSNDKMFQKYFGQMLENHSIMFNTDTISELDKEISLNNHESSTLVKFEQKDKGEIFRISVDTVKDNASSAKRKYSDIKLKNANTKAEMEYMVDKDKLSIRFSDIMEKSKASSGSSELLDEYITIENKNLKEFAKKLDLEEDIIELIPNTINLDNYSLKDLEFTKEESKILKEKYLKIIMEKIPKDHYSKQKDALIMVNGKKNNTTAYSLKLTRKRN